MKTRPVNSWLLLIPTALFSGAILLFLWGTQWPLGIPGEWTWQRAEPQLDAPWNAIVLMVIAAIYLAGVASGATGLARCTRRSGRALLVSGLALLGFFWIWQVQESAPPGQRHSKIPFVLYYPQSSGYFYEQKIHPKPFGKFLNDYEDWMREGDVLHIGTHPPGLFLLFRALSACCESSPAFTQFVLATAPASYHEAADVVEENSARSTNQPPLTPADRATLWLAGLFAEACVALVILPLYGILRQTGSTPTHAWWIAAFWPTVPAAAIFLPKSDAAFAFPALLIIWAWLHALQKQSLLGALLAAGLFWGALQFSLAFLPVAFALALLTAHVLWTAPDRRATAIQLGKLLAAGAGLFLVLVFGIGWATGYHAFEVWLLNYHNHAGFYAQYPRNGWLWRLVNPLELAIALGPVIAIGSLAGAISLIRPSQSINQWARSLGFAFVTTLLVLWLSGKNSGEAARLWLFLMPWCLWLAAQWGRDIAWLATPRAGLMLLSLQLLIAAATVWRITGFHFDAIS